ncbi:hypothetical protein GCM10022381_12570 [Leifsonia kafniensis]|uniref:ATP-binding protein n=1 Tax=Leifsonia kafniensis TaxID=475957 RepID=A0ABP7KAE0_9MICO
MKADLVDIERLGPIDIRDGNGDEFDFPIHDFFSDHSSDGDGWCRIRLHATQTHERPEGESSLDLAQRGGAQKGRPDASNDDSFERRDAPGSVPVDYFAAGVVPRMSTTKTSVSVPLIPAPDAPPAP